MSSTDEEGGSVHALVLAGGSGTRLWPRSTEACPKPFLKIAGGRSLLGDAVARATALAGEDGVLVSARRAHEELLTRELPGIPRERLLLEPVRRNTAPAIALATLAVLAAGGDPILAVLPSDQAVRDEDAFLASLRIAVDSARATDAIVTLGIRPTRPETGFGYMEAREDAGRGARAVLRFVEKPPLADAQRYAASQDFLWNAGIFVFRARVMERELERHAPAVLTAARSAEAARRAGDDAAFEAAFASAPSISIDHAVLEHAGSVLTVPCACGWSDLGSWEAVYEFRGGRGENVLEGPATAVDGTANLVLASGRPIRVVGLSGIAVVDSPEGVLVMRQGASDALRAAVEGSLAAAEAKSA